MTENDRELYIRMAEEFYSSDECSIRSRMSIWKGLRTRRFVLTHMQKSICWNMRAGRPDMV